MEVNKTNGKPLTEQIANAIASHKDPQRDALMKEFSQMYGGFIPEWVKLVPTPVLEGEFRQTMSFDMAPTYIPQKYKTLISLAAAIAQKCPYTTRAGLAQAPLDGATPDEINETIALVGRVGPMSNYLHGICYDMKLFEKDIEKGMAIYAAMLAKQTKPQA